MKATHWSPCKADGIGFMESLPHSDQIEAATIWIRHEMDQGELDAKEIVDGKYIIKLMGYKSDQYGPARDERALLMEGAEDWEDGENWFVPTGETMTLAVSLSFRLVGST